MAVLLLRSFVRLLEQWLERSPRVRGVRFVPGVDLHLHGETDGLRISRACILLRRCLYREISLMTIRLATAAYRTFLIEELRKSRTSYPYDLLGLLSCRLIIIECTTKITPVTN